MVHRDCSYEGDGSSSLGRFSFAVSFFSNLRHYLSPSVGDFDSFVSGFSLHYMILRCNSDYANTRRQCENSLLWARQSVC